MKPDLAHRMTDQELAALEKRIAAEYKKASEELTEKIDAYFERFKERDAEQLQLLQDGKITKQQYTQWRLAQIGRGRRFEALRDRIAERMTKANEAAAAYINDSTPGIYSLNRNYAAYTIEQQVGADVGFDLWDEQTVRRLLVERPDLMPYYPPELAVRRGFDLAWGKSQITRQVTTGIHLGESIKHLADRLQTNIPTMNRDSAIRSARTAVTGAQNAGRQDSYVAAEKMGISLKKQWIATLDNRTRHAHAMADQQTVEEDKPFKLDGYDMMFPGDKSAPGYLVYNCRCTMIALVDGVDMSDAKRRAKDPVTGETVIIENMSYAEWAGWKTDKGIKDLTEEEQIMQDAIAELLKSKGVSVHKDNTVTLYHATTKKNAQSIMRTGFHGTNAPVGGMTGEDLRPRSFFGLDKKWVQETWASDGYEILEIKVPTQYIRQGAGNDLEVYIEGTIVNRGNNIWWPDELPTSTFYDRKAIKRYKKRHGL